MTDSVRDAENVQLEEEDGENPLEEGNTSHKGAEHFVNRLENSKHREVDQSLEENSEEIKKRKKIVWKTKT